MLKKNNKKVYSNKEKKNLNNYNKKHCHLNMQFLIVLSISTSHHYIGHTRQWAMLQIRANLSSNVLVPQVRLKKKNKNLITRVIA